MLDLPGDLVEEILCRIPSTSLKQLRYTCKRWNSLFNKRRFIRKHMDKAAKKCSILMSMHTRVCLMSVNFYGFPSIEVKAEFCLVDLQSSFDELEIFPVSHCEGLLSCNNEDYNRILVWNPCTGQTKWIQPRKIGYYALGSYQDNNYGDNCYKILCCCDDDNKKFEIYEINSNLWRSLDVTLDCELEDVSLGMSLKGKTYWSASDLKEKQLGMFLVNVDYTTEIFERMLLPWHCPYHKTFHISVVREEKLSVLLQLEDTSRTEIWVTNKIDESTKVVSWSKVLTVDLKPHELRIWNVMNFLVDEENKFLLCCQIDIRQGVPIKEIVYIVGEDNTANQELPEFTSSWPFLFHYVPSMTQIQL